MFPGNNQGNNSVGGFVNPGQSPFGNQQQTYPPQPYGGGQPQQQPPFNPSNPAYPSPPPTGQSPYPPVNSGSPYPPGAIDDANLPPLDNTQQPSTYPGQLPYGMPGGSPSAPYPGIEDLRYTWA